MKKANLDLMSFLKEGMGKVNEAKTTEKIVKQIMGVIRMKVDDHLKTN